MSYLHVCQVNWLESSVNRFKMQKLRPLIDIFYMWFVDVTFKKYKLNGMQ